MDILQKAVLARFQAAHSNPVTNIVIFSLTVSFLDFFKNKIVPAIFEEGWCESFSETMTLSGRYLPVNI